MTDGAKRFRISCEFMLRWIFSEEFAQKHRAERPVQYDIVRRLFSEMNRDRSDIEFVQSEAVKGTFGKGETSAMWPSPEFPVPLFAGLATFYGYTLSPHGPRRCCTDIVRADAAFFGSSPTGLETDDPNLAI